MRVLIVEGNETNRDMLKRRLQRHGVEVRVAIEGESAVAEAEWGHPDVILMDISLPNQDGLAVTRRLSTGSGLPLKTPSAPTPSNPFP